VPAGAILSVIIVATGEKQARSEVKLLGGNT